MLNRAALMGVLMVGIAVPTIASGQPITTEPEAIKPSLQSQVTRDDAVGAAEAPADSTKKNLRDKEGATLTPADQAQGSKHDVEVTRRIRKALMADKSLSTNAKNIKIITLNGKTTLRGPVESTKEQSRVVKKATRVAGVRNVTNELEVTNP
jgi:osmotically-inducible protein OsmY